MERSRVGERCWVGEGCVGRERFVERERFVGRERCVGREWFVEVWRGEGGGIGGQDGRAQGRLVASTPTHRSGEADPRERRP